MTSQFAIRLAAHHIRHNGIIIYPTETVYGLGCDPKSYSAVASLNALKQRSNQAGFLLLASDITQLSSFIINPTDQQINLINDTEVATSWITQAHPQAPSWLVATDGTIGFRITKHPVTKALCEQLKHPLISTSANYKGELPAANALQCHRNFRGVVNFILSSNIKSDGTPSVIRNLSNGSRIR